MKKLFLLGGFLAILISGFAQCSSPHIIEFGPVDEPCLITITPDCDSCAQIRMCDGDTIPALQISWRMPDHGTHLYRVWITNACGTDSSSTRIESRGCVNSATGILEPSEDEKIISRCILDMAGRIISNSKLPAGIYEEIFFLKNSYLVKRIVIFK